MMAENVGVYKKIAQVMGSIEKIEKDGYNKHFKFKFNSIDTVSAAVRGHMAEAGLVILPEVISTEPIEIESRNTKGDIETSYLWLITYEFLIVDSETGSSITRKWVSQCERTKDPLKMGTAHSYAQKYFLLRLFLITSEDDPDADTKPSQQKNQNQQSHWSQTDLGKSQIQEIKDKALNEYRWTEDHLSKAAQEVGSIRQFTSLSDYGQALKAAHEKLFPESVGESDEPQAPRPPDGYYDSDEPEAPQDPAQNAPNQPTIATSWQMAMFLKIKGENETDPFSGFETFSAFVINNEIEKGTSPDTVLKLYQETQPDREFYSPELDEVTTKNDEVNDELFFVVDGCRIDDIQIFEALGYDKLTLTELSLSGIHTLPDVIQIVYTINEHKTRIIKRIKRHENSVIVEAA